MIFLESHLRGPRIGIGSSNLEPKVRLLGLFNIQMFDIHHLLLIQRSIKDGNSNNDIDIRLNNRYITALTSSRDEIDLTTYRQ